MSTITVINSTYGAILFCFCGSNRIDVNGWDGNRAVIVCYNCGREGRLDGFTVGRADLKAPQLLKAMGDQARREHPQPVAAAAQGRALRLT